MFSAALVSLFAVRWCCVDVNLSINVTAISQLEWPVKYLICSVNFALGFTIVLAPHGNILYFDLKKNMYQEAIA